MLEIRDLYGNDVFADLEALTVSQEEADVLKELRRLAMKTGHEYGTIYNADGFTVNFTSHMTNRVRIPSELYLGNQVRVYHSHTNNTSFSREDLSLLTRPFIDKISVITPLGLIFVAKRGNGSLPDIEEFQKCAAYIATEVDADMVMRPGFFEWSLERRFHEATREEAFRIARYFKWTIEGGML